MTASHYKGKLIVFSGVDCAGKSTQIELLIKHLHKLNAKPVYLWTRGGYTKPFSFAKKILRKIFGKRAFPAGRTEQRARVFQKNGIAILWLTIAILDLIFVYAIHIRYLKLIGKTIIADRYLPDTWIDFKLNFPQLQFDQWFIWKFLRKILPKPDKTFLLLIPVEESLRRSRLKNEPFPDSEKTLIKRLNFYNQLALEHNWSILNCLNPPEQVRQQIIQLCNL